MDESTFTLTRERARAGSPAVPHPLAWQGLRHVLFRTCPPPSGCSPSLECITRSGDAGPTGSVEAETSGEEDAIVSDWLTVLCILGVDVVIVLLMGALVFGRRARSTRGVV